MFQLNPDPLGQSEVLNVCLLVVSANVLVSVVSGLFRSGTWMQHGDFLVVEELCQLLGNQLLSLRLLIGSIHYDSL